MGRTARRSPGPIPNTTPSSILSRGPTRCFEARSRSLPTRAATRARSGPRGGEPPEHGSRRPKTTSTCKETSPPPCSELMPKGGTGWQAPRSPTTTVWVNTPWGSNEGRGPQHAHKRPPLCAKARRRRHRTLGDPRLRHRNSHPSGPVQRRHRRRDRHRHEDGRGRHAQGPLRQTCSTDTISKIGSPVGLSPGRKPESEAATSVSCGKPRSRSSRHDPHAAWS